MSPSIREQVLQTLMTTLVPIARLSRLEPGNDEQREQAL
jgi:hypothetical protein